MFKTKTEIQDYGIQLTNAHKDIIYEFATGVGKTLTAIRIIEKYGGEWKIIIAETNHELNWINEFKEHGKEHLLANVTFHCYQSLHKVVGNYNYVFDETHHLLSDQRLMYAHDITTYQSDKRNIFLSATLTYHQKETLKGIFKGLHTFKVPLSEAIAMGILPKPSVYLVPVELDNTIKNVTFQFSKTKSTMCTEWQAYKHHCDRVEYFKNKYDGSFDRWDRINWLRAGNNRKRFLSECKTKHAIELVNKLKDKRLICFAGSIPQAKLLGKNLAIHSGIPKKKRLQIIEDFNNQSIHQLFVVDMLKEGMNLKNIEVGIIIQLDNVERYFSQIHGRILRSIAPEQYILFVEESQDTVYLNTALQAFNKEYISYISIDDL